MSVRVIEERCTGCGLCVPVCPVEALESPGQIKLDEKKCTDCLLCVDYCPNEVLEGRT
jgi:electron transfer flavoprotein alpha subunit